MGLFWRVLGMGILLLPFMGLGGCELSGRAAEGDSAGGGAETLSIMTWNVQALFDGEETGDEYDEYLNSAGWSGEKYASRLNVMGRAIGGMGTGVPDILALEEVENAGVLEELAAGPLGKHGYQWVFFANNSGSSLGIGILSRFPLLNTRAHSLSFNGETTPRPVMEVWIDTGDKPPALFICHWKSKLGGDDLTEGLRRASARIILRRIREIRKENPHTPIAIMGDLNENHDEFYRRNGALITALLPDDPRAAELTGLYRANGENAGDSAEKIEELQADFLILGKTKPPAAVYFPPGAAVLYSPWGRELENGSYYYRNAWETIDHVLLSESFFDGAGWDFDAVYTADQPPFTRAGGTPDAYNPRTGSGLSDHLPLVLTLKYMGD
ncbi:MAG: endonuclease/exonuclease/phosphatase family protein [Treponema sp.]|jgi:endonuclease/exonuclease/phosphatase family metal-dependent hydrolase|nr:endonuclease/exonuclease/phosphatase family protein [Treponema sp.]